MRLLRKPVRNAFLLLLATVIVLNWTWGGFPDEPKSRLTKSVAGKFDQVAYLESDGSRSRGRQSVLMLHGLPGTHADWERVWPLLDGVRPIVIDRPGFGASGGETGSLREQAAAVHDLLTRLGATPAVIAGHSYGGTLALAIASLYPEDVKALVLVASAAAGTHQNTGDAIQAWSVRLLNQPIVTTVARAIFNQAATRAVSRAGVEDAFDPRPVDDGYWQRFLKSTTRPEDMRAFASEKLSFNDDLDWLDAVFPAIEKPAVVIHGRADKLVSSKSGRRQAEAIDAKLVLLPTGHMVTYSHPQTIANEIKRLAAEK